MVSHFVRMVSIIAIHNLVGGNAHADSGAAHQYPAIVFARCDGFSHGNGHIGINRIVAAVIFAFITEFNQVLDDGLFEPGGIGIATD
jgi:hypothetical protein